MHNNYSIRLCGTREEVAQSTMSMKVLSSNKNFWNFSCVFSMFECIFGIDNVVPIDFGAIIITRLFLGKFLQKPLFCLVNPYY